MRTDLSAATRAHGSSIWSIALVNSLISVPLTVYGCMFVAERLDASTAHTFPDLDDGAAGEHPADRPAGPQPQRHYLSAEQAPAERRSL